MLALLVAAQIGAADSMYASVALRAVVEQASQNNRRVPADLQSYRASVESELAFIVRRSDGVEAATSIEQVRSEARWLRSGAFEQRVVGYRSQSLGVTFSAVGFFRQAWAVPVLYGNRLSLLFGRENSRMALGRARARPLMAVHPLAEDRERVYRYRGGDTVVTMRIGDRAIPIVQVLVEPRPDAPARTVAFRGELDLDATRLTLVRMRGYFVAIDPPQSLFQRALSLGGVEGIAFVELENGEIEGRWWLPVYQRFEAQVAWMTATDTRSVFRVVSRFRDHRMNDTTVVASDTLTPLPHALTFAPRDSLDHNSSWRADLGAATASVHADDFLDVAPGAWRPNGPPRGTFRVQRLMDAFHFNRIEGAYTGYGAEYRFRDEVPGLSLYANGGWAWSESAARGRVSVQWKRGPWTRVFQAGRTLDLTNDFRSALDSGPTFGALFFGADDYDYVDRRTTSIAFVRAVGKGRIASIRLETGPSRDGMVWRTTTHSLIRSDSGFRENRGVREGSYWRTVATLEWQPDVSAEYMRPGIGAMLRAEHAMGDLDYARLEGRIMVRENLGSLTLAARVDGGVLLGDAPPPQQLFEIGATQNLPGYGYKEFAGTEAMVARTLVMYRLPRLLSPLRLGRWTLPSPAPALSAGLQSGWADVRGAGGDRALRELGVIRLPGDTFPRELATPMSRPTGGIRTSVSLGVRFFGGALGMSLARAVDRKAQWRFLLELAQLL